MTISTAPPTSETARNRRPSWLEVSLRSLISLVILGAAVATFFAVGKKTPPPRQPAEEAAPLVRVDTIVQHVGGIDIQADGVVIPFREIEVPTEVEGRIAYKSDKCRIGHTVEKGELLVRIDPEDYELELRRLGENVKQARANLQELEVEITARNRQIALAEEDLQIKRREVDRYEKIDDPGVYSKSEIDAARLKELQARDALQTEKDQLELLEASRKRLESAIDLGLAQLDKAKLNLSRTEIRAPISGIVTREGPEEGGYLQRGGMVAVVQDTSLMEIRCSLPMRQMGWLWQADRSEGALPTSDNAYELPDTPATVRFFDMGAATCKWEGRLAYFDGGRVDQQTRMVPCRVVVDRPENVELVGEAKAALESAPLALLAGMFVTVEIHASPGIKLLSLPEQAVQPGNEVWTVRKEITGGADGSQTHGVLKKEQLNVAHTTDTEVLAYPHGSNLKVGDMVVVSPLASPIDGTVVEIMESK